MVHYICTHVVIFLQVSKRNSLNSLDLLTGLRWKNSISLLEHFIIDLMWTSCFDIDFVSQIKLTQLILIHYFEVGTREWMFDFQYTLRIDMI